MMKRKEPSRELGKSINDRIHPCKFWKSPHNIAALALLGIVGLPGVSAMAQTSVAKKSPFVGAYHHDEVDSAENLAILPDRKFCFALSDGTEDHLTAGRWKPTEHGIVLEEVKMPSNGIFAGVMPHWQGQEESSGPVSVNFLFDGQSLGGQGTFVFGFSEDETLPKEMRPVFTATANELSGQYALPPVTGSVKSFFIAYREHPEGPRTRSRMYRVLQFHLPEVKPPAELNDPSARLVSMDIAIGFDSESVQPPLHFNSEIRDGVLFVDGAKFGDRQELPDEMKADSPECTKLIEQAEKKVSTEPELMEDGSLQLKPVRSFDQELHIEAAKPYFTAPSDDKTAK
jgi:hypothetical protein